MQRILGPYAPQFFALLRIIAGVMFAMHGAQKLFGWPGNNPPMRGVPLMLAAGIIELVGGVLIAIGLFTGIAALISSGEMAAAFFMGHVMSSGTIVPIINKGEVAVLYCFLFLFIAAHGAGIWSVDGARGRATR
jgi:putative oxidoreductase